MDNKYSALYGADSIKNWKVLLLLSLYYVAFSYVWQNYLFTDDVYYNSFGEQVSIERIEKYITIQRKVWWISVIILPLVTLFKTSLVAICLNVGTLFSGLKVKFTALLKVALIAESVFIVASFVRVIWLYCFIDYRTINDIKMFYPFSVLNWVKDEVPIWFTYPLQTLNLFEIIYWFVLAFGLKQLVDKPYKKVLTLVIASYGIGLLIWAVFIMFLSVNFN